MRTWRRERKVLGKGDGLDWWSAVDMCRRSPWSAGSRLPSASFQEMLTNGRLSHATYQAKVWKVGAPLTNDIRMTIFGIKTVNDLDVQQEHPQMHVTFKSCSKPILQATTLETRSFFCCLTKSSTQAKSISERLPISHMCRFCPGGHASVIHAARP